MAVEVRLIPCGVENFILTADDFVLGDAAFQVGVHQFLNAPLGRLRHEFPRQGEIHGVVQDLDDLLAFGLIDPVGQILLHALAQGRFIGSGSTK